MKYDNPVLVTAHEHMIFFKRQREREYVIMESINDVDGVGLEHIIDSFPK